MSDTTNHDEIRNTERALKSALRRIEASHGFMDRVLVRIEEQRTAPTKAVPHNSWFDVFTRPIFRWTAATAAAVAILVGATQYREVQAQRERAEGEAAKHQLVLALRIAGSKLQRARSKVNQIQANPPDDREEKE